jgi:glycosyltransferase involved in cell wall biosynthesis
MKLLDIYINSRFLTQKITGSQRFAIEISRQLKKILPEARFVSPKNIIHYDIAKELEVESFGKLTGHLWEQIELPLYLRKKGSPLLLNLVNTAPIFYKNKMVVIHDISWKHFPDAVSKKFYLWYKFLIPKISKTSKSIFTVSNFSKKDISEGLNVDINKFEVVYNAISENFKFLNISREKIILSVASLQPYKNLEGLIKAFIVLKNKNKFFDFKLVLVGGYNKKVFAKTNVFELSKNREDIVFTGYLPDEKLVEYYNRASLFVFPSFFEGFGLPPLEAMACGCPCVVSNAASLPEVCGDAVVYCNPYDPEDIARAMYEVLNSEDLRNYLVQKGFERVKMFSWEKTAREILKIIEEVV